MSVKKWKVYTNLWAQDIWKASMSWLKCIRVVWHCGDKQNHLWCSTHLVQFPEDIWVHFPFAEIHVLVCLDSLSASTATDPGKYLTVIAFFRFKRYFQITFLVPANSWLFKPHIFIKYDKAIKLPTWIWTDIASFFFIVKVIIAHLTALSSKAFM